MTGDGAFEADAYERYLGRWSRMVARDFVAWLAVPRDKMWLDVACGTGALTQTILDACGPRHVDACDEDGDLLEYARRRSAGSRVAFRPAEAPGLPYATGAYDAVVSGLPFPAIREPAAVLARFVSLVAPGGVVGLYVWDFYGEMQILRTFWEAATALDPQADEDDSDPRFAICRPQRLGAALREAGLHAVDVRALDVCARFENFDDYWQPFLHGSSAAQRHVRSLTPERRAALIERLRTRLPFAQDGSLTLPVRAWAGRGYVRAGAEQ